MMQFLILLSLLIAQSALSAATLTGRTVRVTDGDTIVILSEGNVQHKIRLQGIDAPERGQAYGTKSKDHLSGLVAGRFVVVEYDKRDRYGRIVGEVLVGDKDACLEQISAGYAWHYKKYQNEQTGNCTQRLRLRRETLNVGCGRTPHAIPPWEYRAIERSR